MRVILDLLHELTNTRMFGLFHNCMWQSRYSEIFVHFVERCGRTDWLSNHNVSPFYHDLHLRFCLCLCLSLNGQQTNRYPCSHERNVYRFLEHSNGTFVLSQRVSPFFMTWIRVWLSWLVDFCLPSNFWTQFLHPIMSQGNLRRQSRWFIYFFVNDFSSFHPNNSRDTMNWEYIVKNDDVRSRLTELQSFLLSKFDYDPIYRVLMFLSRWLHVLCKTRASRSIVSGSLCSLSIGSTGRKNTVYRLLKFWLPDINLELMIEFKLIAHPTWYLRKPQELKHRLVKKTNDDNAGNISEDHLWFSRIQSLHLLL